jgi:hypothetical protein
MEKIDLNKLTKEAGTKRTESSPCPSFVDPVHVQPRSRSEPSKGRRIEAEAPLYTFAPLGASFSLGGQQPLPSKKSLRQSDKSKARLIPGKLDPGRENPSVKPVSERQAPADRKKVSQKISKDSTGRLSKSDSHSGISSLSGSSDLPPRPRLVALSVVIPPSQRQVTNRRMRSVSPTPSITSSETSPERTRRSITPLSETGLSQGEDQSQNPVHPEPKHPFQKREGTQNTLVAVDLPTQPGTDEGRRLTTRQVKQHPNVVHSEGPGEEVIFPWEISGTMTVSAISMFWGAEQHRSWGQQCYFWGVSTTHCPTKLY